MYAGIGGRLGVGSSLGAYVRKITAMEKPENLDDPREAVLKYAKVPKTPIPSVRPWMPLPSLYGAADYNICNFTVHLFHQIAEEDPYFIAPAYKK